MAAPPLSNTFESGQADGTTVSTGNSGGAAGNAFDAITSTPVYSTGVTAHSGSLAMKIDTGVAANIHADWTALGSLTASVYGRVYLYIPSAPSAQSPRLVGMRVNGGSACAWLAINVATGCVGMMNAAQTIVSQTVGTTPVPTGQWVRIEWRVLPSATNGELEWWLYSSADSSTVTETKHVLQSDGLNIALGANVDQVRFGNDSATAPTAFVAYFDDAAVSSTGPIGPTVTAAVPELFSVSDPRGFRLPGIH